MTHEITLQACAEVALPNLDFIGEWLKTQTPRTRRGYASDLADFAEWLPQWLNAESPEEAIGILSPGQALAILLRRGQGWANRTVMAYRLHLEGRKPKNRSVPAEVYLSSAVINRRLAALRSFVKYGRTIAEVNWSLDIPNVKTKKSAMRGPRAEDVQRMQRAAAGIGEGMTARRLRAIFSLLFDLALRRAEVCSIDLADIELGQDGCPIAVMVLGKGQREKERLTLPGPTAKAIADWIKVRGDHPGPLFHRLDGHLVDGETRMSGETIKRIVSRLGRIARVPGEVRAHGLRHAAITAAIVAKRGLHEVQQFSRHRSLEMVMRYFDAVGDTAGDIARELADLRMEGKPRT